MATPGQMTKAARELFNEELDVAIPRLMSELHAPHRVAAVLHAAPNSARKWLIRRGWTFDGEKWIAPEVETDHA